MDCFYFLLEYCPSFNTESSTIIKFIGITEKQETDEDSKNKI